MGVNFPDSPGLSPGTSQAWCSRPPEKSPVVQNLPRYFRFKEWVGLIKGVWHCENSGVVTVKTQNMYKNVFNINKYALVATNM